MLDALLSRVVVRQPIALIVERLARAIGRSGHDALPFSARNDLRTIDDKSPLPLPCPARRRAATYKCAIRPRFAPPPGSDSTPNPLASSTPAASIGVDNKTGRRVGGARAPCPATTCANLNERTRYSPRKSRVECGG